MAGTNLQPVPRVGLIGCDHEAGISRAWQQFFEDSRRLINGTPWIRVSDEILLKDESGDTPVSIRAFDDSLSPELNLYRGNGSETAPTVVTSADVLGEYAFGGFLETDTFARSAILRAIATQNWSPSGESGALSGAWAQIGGDSINSSWAAAAYGFDLFNGMASDGTYLYLGLGGASAGQGDLWRWNGTVWDQIGGDGLNSGWAGSTYEVAKAVVAGGVLYALLGSSSGDAEVWQWSGSAWTKIGGDGVNSGWTGLFTASSAASDGSQLYVGLSTTSGGAQVWRWGGSTWVKVGGQNVNGTDWNTNPSIIHTVHADADYVYVGMGTSAGDGEVWRFDIAGTAWTKIGGDGVNSSFTHQNVYHILAFGDDVVVTTGGNTTSDGEVWLWDGTWTKIGGDGVNSSWNGTHHEVRGAAEVSGTLYVGLGVGTGLGEVWEYKSGSWSKVGGDSENSSWASKNRVNNIATHGGYLYATAVSSSNDPEVWRIATTSVARAGTKIRLLVAPDDSETPVASQEWDENGDVNIGGGLNGAQWVEADRRLAVEGFGVRDAEDGELLIITPSEDLSADRTLQVTMDDADQTLNVPDLVEAASAFGTDNVLIKSDGTGRLTQATGITVDDSDNVTGVTSLRIDTDDALDYHLRLSPSTDTSSRTKVRWDNAAGTELWNLGMSSSSNMKMWDGTQNVIDWTRNGTMIFNPGGTISLHDVNITTANHVTGVATLTLPNTGLHLLDTNASHDLIIKPGSDLTADRTLTITTGDADRTLTLGGDASIDGTEVQAAAVIGDNALVRGDGGSRGVQAPGTTTVLLDDGNLVLGAATPESTLASIGNSLHPSNDGDFALVAPTVFATSAFPIFIGVRGRGTKASPTAVQSGDNLFQLDGRGYDDTTPGDLSIGASMEMFTLENWSPTTTGAGIRFRTTAAGATGRVVRAAITGVGNVTLGNNLVTDPTTGDFALILNQGTALSGMITNTGAIQAKDVSGTAEVFAVDEGATATQISSHNFTMFEPDPLEPFPWSFYSEQPYLGKRIGVDMAKLARLVEDLTGEKLIYVEDIPGPRPDWNADQDRNIRLAREALAVWTRQKAEAEAARQTFSEPRPEIPARKPMPKWMADRLEAAA